MAEFSPLHNSDPGPSLEDNNSERETTKNKKKKKSGKVSSWLSQFLPVEETETQQSSQPEADQSQEMPIGKQRRFTKRLQSLFGSWAQLELNPESIADSSRESNIEESAQTEHVSSQHLGAEAPEGSEGISIIDPQDRSSYDRPTEVYLRSDSDVTRKERTVVPTDNPDVAWSAEGEGSRGDLEDTREMSGSAVDDDSGPIERVRSFDVRSHEKHDGGVLSFADVEQERVAEPQTLPYRPSTSAGPALLGFVAAETLSRHRDAKIRKEAEKLKQRVVNQEKKLDEQQREGHEIRLRQDRSEAEHHKHSTKEHSTHTGADNAILHQEDLRGPTDMKRPHLQPDEGLADVLHKEVPPARPLTSESNHSHEAVRFTTRGEAEPRYKGQDDTSEKVVSRMPIREELVLRQVEQAAEQDIALESYYERRHEVKDEPSLVRKSDTAAQNNNLHDKHYNTSTIILANPVIEKNKPGTPDRPLYEHAVRQGVIGGAVVAVALAVVALIWNLV